LENRQLGFFVESFLLSTTGVLNVNGEVHIVCGVSNLETAKQYLQIQGKSKISRDAVLRDEMWKDFMTKYFSGTDDQNYRVGIVKPYHIELFTMASRKPKIWGG
jgi:general stress protein 26